MEPKSTPRLIDAEALKKRLQKDPLYVLVERYGITGVIDAEPTVDAVPVRHGRWVEWPECAKYADAYSEDHIACSVCGHVFNVLDNNCEEFKYCPNCGAKMDAKREKKQ